MKQSNSRNSAFQLTASQGGWPHLAGWPLSVPYFNSQPHKEADKDVIVPSRPIWYFNSQPHKEADPALDLRVSASMYFNSQPHKEADFQATHSTLVSYLFQLTASQGGWQPDRTVLSSRVWDFNSQPHKEADCCLQFFTKACNVFQLTASQGGWQVGAACHTGNRTISTHSLTRRLTILTGL